MVAASIPKIIEALQASYGEAFFNTITLQLHRVIEADYTFIARLDLDNYTSRTISLIAKGKVVDNIEYSLENTPCADVACKDIGIFPKDICALYPKDQLLCDMKIEGYIGTPLRDSADQVIGLVVAMYEHEIYEPDSVLNLFRLFSGRISAEIERSEKEQELELLNASLESKVKERTEELTVALENLKATQKQIVEQEKLASLGQLVAGVAHEINTPLGVAILGGSTIQEHIQDLKRSVESGKLTKSALENCLDNISEAEEALEFNLQRAAELVRNFKQVAVEHNTDQLTDIEMNKWLTALLTSLRPMVKKMGVTLTLVLPEKEHQVITYPSKISQVITNLLSNVTMHAYPPEYTCCDKEVVISFEPLDDELVLSVADNGIGMSEETRQHLLEPFYTTKRGGGGTGLGMSIVSNIVSSQLKGRLEVESTEGCGSKFKVVFKSYDELPDLNPDLE